MVAVIALRTAACCAGVTLALCVAATQVHAKPPAHMISSAVISINGTAHTVAPPNAPCDEDHVFDIHITANGFFECVCEHMPFGRPICDWYQVTSPAHDPHHAPRIKAKHHKRMIIRHALPTVVS